MRHASDDTISSMQKVPRLIEKFKPTNYNLSVVIDRKNRQFSGTVTIKGMVQSGCKDISLHSKGLSIESALVDGKNADYKTGKFDSLLITHPDIKPGKHIVVIGFSGKITDSLHGMYPCYYEHDGTQKELIATQFESHHAREVFPCIDEPEARASFDVTITSEPNVTVLGNMPIKKQVVEDGKLVTTFETTPAMSTYLLAWVIGELHSKTTKTKSGVSVSVWATPAQPKNSLDFALDIATRTIDFYDDFYDTPYPLSKCDHVALPDFAVGAMENWGLITYREIALLAEPGKTSLATRQNIATTITHEISHQWFGNLVTMKWWNDLWLNESFASLVEYDAVDYLEPDWNIWTDFDSYESVIALRRDSIDGVQSVQVDVNHPDEISTLFDGAIVYAKGAKLLKMLRRYIGYDDFKKGLKEYFKKYAYQNTVGNDLWSIFDKISGKDISSFMNTWISQPGFPVLHVVKNGNEVFLSQNRLSNDPDAKSNSLWPITLNSNHPEIPEIFNKKQMKITLQDDAPLRFNTGNDAHYVTHYDHELMDGIIQQIKSNKLPVSDRLQVLNDQIILASVGIISNSELISLLGAYENETNDSVWDVIAMTIGEMKKFVEDDESSEVKLRALAGTLAKKQFARLGWNPDPDEPESDTKLRPIVVGLTLYSEDDTATRYAINLFNTTEVEDLNPDLRPNIISTAIKNTGSEKPAQRLLEIYADSQSSELRRDITSGITATKNEKIANMLLEKIKDTKLIKTQDTIIWVIYLIRNKYTRDIAWGWIRNNWDWVNQVFGGDKRYDDFPQYSASALSRQKQLDEYISFFTPLKSDPALTRVIEMGINEIKNRVNLIERDGKAVRQALDNLALPAVDRKV